VAVLIDLPSKGRDVLLYLSFQRGGDHPTRALPSEVIEADLYFIDLPSGERANIFYGVTSCRLQPAYRS
jgi:hypothetical protein